MQFCEEVVDQLRKSTLNTLESEFDVIRSLGNSESVHFTD